MFCGQTREDSLSDLSSQAFQCDCGSDGFEKVNYLFIDPVHSSISSIFAILLSVVERILQPCAWSSIIIAAGNEEAICSLTFVDPKKQHPQQVNMMYMVSAQTTHNMEKNTWAWEGRRRFLICFHLQTFFIASSLRCQIDLCTTKSLWFATCSIITAIRGQSGRAFDFHEELLPCLFPSLHCKTRLHLSRILRNATTEHGKVKPTCDKPVVHLEAGKLLNCNNRATEK